MNLGLGPLIMRIEDSQRRLVLATVVATEGSTYRKPGAMMLLDEAGQFTGLVSGGCLETDLYHRAQSVLTNGVAEIATYDLREDDPIWGLGLGCQGLVKILLQVADHTNDFAGLAALAPHHDAGQTTVLSKVIDPQSEHLGHWQLEAADVLLGGSKLPTITDQQRLNITISPPPHLLICGAGPDAGDLVELAVRCDWRVSVTDHRPKYAQADQFSSANSVLCQPAGEGLQHFKPTIDAAVVMSHHLPSDIAYVRQLVSTEALYIGLLGPTARREQILSEAKISDPQRFFGPAGLDIGADLPATIGLAILAEAHAVINDREGGFLREKDRR